LITSELQRLLKVNLQMMSAFHDNTTVKSLAEHIRGLASPEKAPHTSLSSTASSLMLQDGIGGSGGGLGRKLSKQPTMREIMKEAGKAARKLRTRLPTARSIEGLAEKLYAIGTSSWSFGFYVVVQYILSTLAWFVVPICFSLTALGLIFALAKIEVSGYIGFPLLMAGESCQWSHWHACGHHSWHYC
jgi:hypothetical protein